MVQSNSFSSGFDAVFGRGLSLFLLPDGGGGGGGRGGGMDRGEVEEVNVFFAFLLVLAGVARMLRMMGGRCGSFLCKSGHAIKSCHCTSHNKILNWELSKHYSLPLNNCRLFAF